MELSGLYADDDSLSMTAIQRWIAKEKPGSGSCERQSRKIPIAAHLERSMGLNRGHLRQRLLFSELSQESPVELRRNYFVHNRCNSQSCKFELVKKYIVEFTQADFKYPYIVTILFRPLNSQIPI
ncbi:hypothetical protein Zmor_010769 [Zophobas morio]|uniref:Uncharacterized protein n=1 Tax=Zophobas morio TaxID=2755281 RepID=A0AA38MJ20_9CUCU|nr:hypothetical protein Zmor_010769 [Zophobas morio]